MRRRPLLLVLLLLAGVGVVAWVASRTSVQGDALRAPPVSTSGAPGAPAPLAGSVPPRLHGAGPPPSGAPAPAAPARARLEGQVVDAADGIPVAGVRVQLFARTAPSGPHVVRTDAEGRFVLEGIADGAWWIVTWHPLYIPAGLQDVLLAGVQGAAATSAQVVIDGAQAPVVRTTVRLHAGRRIEGRVLDPTGAPQAGATIQLAPHPLLDALCRSLDIALWELQAFTSFASDEEGRFAFAFLPPLVAGLRVGAFLPGHVCRWSDPLDLGFGRTPGEVVLHLVPAAAVQGRATHEDGAAAEGVLVHAVGSDDVAGTWAFPWPEAVETEASGNFTVGGLPPADVQVAAWWAKPYLRAGDALVAGLTAGEVRSGVDLVVSRRYVLRVVLVSEQGGPLFAEQVIVRAWSDPDAPPDGDPHAVERVASARTDEEGRVALAFDRPGPYRVVHEAWGQETVLADLLRLPAEELRVVVAATPHVDLAVCAVDPGGLPVSVFHAKAEALDGASGRARGSAVSGSPGPGGIVRLRVPGEPPFLIAVSEARTAGGRELPIGQVRLDEVPSEGCVQVVLGIVGRFSGRIVDAQGGGIPGTRLSLVAEGDDGTTAVLDVPVDSSGQFGLDVPVSHGVGARIRLVVPDGHLPVRLGMYHPADGPRDVTLPRAGTVRGRLLLPEGVEIEGASLVWLDWDPIEGVDDQAPVPLVAGWAEIGADGRFVARVPLDREVRLGVSPLAAGQLGLQAPPGEWRARSGDAGLEIVLERGLSIRGRLIQPGGLVPRLVVLGRALDEERAPALVFTAPDGSFELKGLSSGRWFLRVVSASASEATLATLPVEAGARDLVITLPELGRIDVDTEPSEDWPTATAWIAGTCHRFSSALFVLDEPRQLPVPLDAVIDVVVRAGDEMVGHAARVRAGQAVTVRLVKGQVLAGQAHGTASRRQPNLVARGDGCCFDLDLDDDGHFEGLVEPGMLYDIVSVDLDGTERILARGIAAGQQDVSVTLDG